MVATKRQASTVASDGGKPVTFGVLGGTAIKPKERHGWEAIRYLIHNPETGEVFTRTPKSWFLITLFYCIYYTCLACFWYGMLQLFFLTLPVDQPKWTLTESIIGVDPGMGMRPLARDERIDSSMIRLDWDNANENPSPDYESEMTIDWAYRMQKFLKSYENKTGTVDCTSVQGLRNTPDDKEPCAFELSTLGACQQFPYGYVKGSAPSVEPCVVFKVNKIYNWEPQIYTDEDLDAEEEMPQHLKDSIRAMSLTERENLFVNCEGEYPTDQEALMNSFTYFPATQGIPFKYYPYKYAHMNYHNPLVALQLKNVPKGQLLHIECRLWAKGIKYDRKERIGMKRFELLLDDGQPDV